MIIGVLLISFGFAVRIAAILKLKGDFSFTIGKPNSVQTGGVYKYIRHPAYLGSIAIIGGVSIISPAIAVVWLAIAFFTSRALIEESIIDYPGGYKAKTGMFLPKVRTKNKKVRGR
jgi:protein-S-isoprenylcysteine O-methyltransferase Ste14